MQITDFTPTTQNWPTAREDGRARLLKADESMRSAWSAFNRGSLADTERFDELATPLRDASASMRSALAAVEYLEGSSADQFEAVHGARTLLDVPELLYLDGTDLDMLGSRISGWQQRGVELSPAVQRGVRDAMTSAGQTLSKAIELINSPA